MRILILLFFCFFIGFTFINNEKSIAILTENKEGYSEDFFDINSPFSVDKLAQNNNFPSSSKDTLICDTWKLDEKVISKFIRASNEINGSEWHVLFDHLPCGYEAIIYQNEHEFNLYINGGSWFTISSSNKTKRYGYFGSEKSFFLSDSWREDD